MGAVCDAVPVDAFAARLSGPDDAVVHFAAESHNDQSLRASSWPIGLDMPCVTPSTRHACANHKVGPGPPDSCVIQHTSTVRAPGRSVLNHA